MLDLKWIRDNPDALRRMLANRQSKFDVGGLLALDGHWQKLENIRILMGDEVSKRTQDAFRRALNQIEAKLDASLETEKDRDDFLRGVPAIVNALKTGTITCKVYRERKFHAKAYITHSKFEVMGSTALVGSRNGRLSGVSCGRVLLNMLPLYHAWASRTSPLQRESVNRTLRYGFAPIATGGPCRLLSRSSGGHA
jgi:hypothetical protein